MQCETNKHKIHKHKVYAWQTIIPQLFKNVGQHTVHSATHGDTPQAETHFPGHFQAFQASGYPVSI